MPPIRMSGFDREGAGGQLWRVPFDSARQWQSSPLARHGRAGLRAPWRPGTWGWLLWLGMALACSPRRQDECATVQARVLEEVRVVDGFHDHVHDAESIVLHSRRLREVSAGLRALDLQDADLRAAVQRYHLSIDRLAEAWAQAAAPNAQGLPDAGADAGLPGAGVVALSGMLSVHAAAVNGARSSITTACGAR